MRYFHRIAIQVPLFSANSLSRSFIMIIYSENSQNFFSAYSLSTYFYTTISILLFSLYVVRPRWLVKANHRGSFLGLIIQLYNLTGKPTRPNGTQGRLFDIIRNFIWFLSRLSEVFRRFAPKIQIAFVEFLFQIFHHIMRFPEWLRYKIYPYLV